MDGGADGSVNLLEIARKQGNLEQHGRIAHLDLAAGDVVRIVSGGGGGWGDPALRDPALIAEDIRNGLLTAERAQEIYGTTGDAA